MNRKHLRAKVGPADTKTAVKQIRENNLVQIVDSEISFNFKQNPKRLSRIETPPDTTNTTVTADNAVENSEEFVDKEISFNFNKQNPMRPITKIEATTGDNIPSEANPDEKSEELVDNEISFNFNTPRKTETTTGKPEIKTEIEWLKTMVIIYQDLFSFDIKTEKKDDYEEKVNLFPVKKKKKKRRRFGRY